MQDQKHMLQGIKLADTAPTLTRLFFADDAILFTRDSKEDMFQMIKLLNTFTIASGQKINLTKSGIICGSKVDESLKFSLSNNSRIPIWTNPGNYLGIPAEWGGSKVQGLNWLKENVLAKLEGWKGNLLNQAGKKVLIKVVIHAIPSYIMDILTLPKTFCYSLTSSVAKFMWKSSGKANDIHCKKFLALCLPKDQGGIGFKYFQKLNTALLAKPVWRLIQDPSSYWGATLKSIYYPNFEFWQASTPRGSSWVWKSLIQGRGLLTNAGRWSIGFGEQIDITKDL